MSNILASIDLLSIEGAKRTATASGKDVVVIDLAASRATPHTNGKVYLSLDIKEKKEPDQFGKTHFITEGRTKEEREAKTQLPIIGSGKAFTFSDNKQKQPTKPRVQEERYEGRQVDDGGDEIPF
jgi:hypothetical protein